jgi:hypothetical protein
LGLNVGYFFTSRVNEEIEAATEIKNKETYI